jgi:hypothetical protein
VGAQELTPAEPSPRISGRQPGLAKNRRDARRRDSYSDACQLTDDSLVAPASVLVRKAQNQLAGLRRHRRPTRPLSGIRPPSANKLAMPAKQRLRANEEGRTARTAQQPAGRRQKHSVTPIQPRPSHLAAKNRELVAQHHDLEFLELARAETERRHRQRTPKEQLRRLNRIYAPHSGPRQTRLAQVVNACFVEPLDEALAKSAGELCGKAKVADVLDAAVVASAARRGDAVLTSDPRDLRRLASLAGSRGRNAESLHGASARAACARRCDGAYVQRRATRWRCQRSSVFGLTARFAHAVRGIARLSAANSTGSARVSLGRPACRRSTASSCRTSGISNSFERRGRASNHTSANKFSTTRYTNVQSKQPSPRPDGKKPAT